LYLVILGICLRWFGPTAALSAPPQPRAKRGLFPARVAMLRCRLAHRVAQPNPASVVPSPLQRIGLITIVFALMVVIASSHQLTPFMVISSLMALVIFRLCWLRGLPLTMVVLTVTWIIYLANAFVEGNIHWVILSIGRLTNNVESNLVDLSLTSPGQRFVALAGRGLTVALWGMALLGGLRRLYNGFWDLACALLILSPFLMLAGNSYGGEMLFRVYFFSAPFMAFFAAALLYPHLAAGRSWPTAVLTV